MPIDNTGPYLTVAALCEKALEEKDGVMSLIRVIDRITVSAGQGAPEEMPAIPIQVTGVFMFKSGMQRGMSTFKLMLEEPNGDEKQAGEMPVLFEGEDRGNNIVININFEARQQGLYWFAVYLDDVLFTRVPLRVFYLRIVGPSLHL